MGPRLTQAWGAKIRPVAPRRYRTRETMNAQTLDLRRFVGRWTLDAMSHVGRVSLLVWDAIKSLAEWRVWLPRTFTEAWNIGVGSLFIVLLISGFAGAVTALQARYQFTGTIPIYYLAGVIVESIVLELGPVLTGLVLAGPDRRALRGGAGDDAGHRADRRAGEPGPVAGLAPDPPAGAGGLDHDPGARRSWPT